jgi:type VI secretion system secreted protein VgrG
MPVMELSFAGGETSLSVRRFSVQESLSTLFAVSVWASSRPVAPHAAAQLPHLPAPRSAGHHRRLLGEHNVDHAWNADRGRYPKLEYKVQYGESDYTFVSRLLEEAGIAFVFADPDASGTLLTFDDQLPARTARAALRYVDHPNKASEKEFVTKVRLSHEVRPGAQTLRDYDFRNPAFPLFAEAPKAARARGASTSNTTTSPAASSSRGRQRRRHPVADDHGTARTIETYGKDKASRYLDAPATAPASAAVSFDTNAFDLYPGALFSIANHPHAEIAESTAPPRRRDTHGGLPGRRVGRLRKDGVRLRALPAPAAHPRSRRVRASRAPPSSAPRGRRSTPTSSAACACSFPGIARGKFDDHSSCWIRVSRAGPARDTA